MNPDLSFLSGHHLAVYSSHDCFQCTQLEAWMQKLEVPHTKVYIDDDPTAADKLESETGKQAVPFILVDGRRWVRGYHRAEPPRSAEAVLLDELRAAVEA